MAKSADAFRTISEVAEWLETPAHVLRFWESKFAQVKPVKRAGGRRYYRPADMQLLGGIKKLLHDDGMTIKGVQKLLREQGVKHVVALSQPLDEVTVAAVGDGDVAGDTTPDVPPAETATVLPFEKDALLPEPAPPAPEVQPDPEPVQQSFLPPPPEAPASTAERQDDVEETALADTGPITETDPVTSEPPPEAPLMPSFTHRRMEEAKSAEPTEESSPAKPTPIKITLPEDPADDMSADPGILSRLSGMEPPLSPALIDSLNQMKTRLGEMRSASNS